MVLSQLDRLRRFRVPLVVGTVLAVVILGYPGGIAAAYQNAIELPQLTEELDQLYRDRARLERESVLLANRISVKESLMDDLIAGRLTLLAVSEQFAELNSDEGSLVMIRQHFAGDNDLERNANNVLSYAELRVRHPSAKELMLEELNRQFRHTFGREAAWGKRP